jgi:hypothetical protein
LYPSTKLVETKSGKDYGEIKVGGFSLDRLFLPNLQNPWQILFSLDSSITKLKCWSFGEGKSTRGNPG